MDGDQALQYARSRHGSSDFDRGQRQQRVLLSLREQANPQDLIPRLPELINALKKAVRTDIPVEPARRSCSVSRRRSTRRTSGRTCSPRPSTRPSTRTARAATSSSRTSPRSGRRSRPRSPRVPADEALREKLADEAAGVWVLYGGADRDRPNSAWRATSTSTAWPPRRRARSRPAPCRRPPRSWSTTVAATSARARSRTSSRRSG